MDAVYIPHDFELIYCCSYGHALRVLEWALGYGLHLDQEHR